MEPMEQHWEKLSRRPFIRLVCHCVDRIFAGSEGAEPGELDLSIGTILALLATPGAFASFFLLDRYGSLMRFLHGQSIRFEPYAASLPDEYFFIVLALVVAGFVAVWKWDRLLPDRRDYANLAPLPIASRRIFLANLVALSLLAVVLSLDVNALSSLLFPFVVCAQEPIRVLAEFFATHTLSVVLASAFGFLGVFAVLGTMMAVLPYGIFRKCSLYARCGIILFLMALLTTSFSEPHKIERLHSPYQWAKVPPSGWFLGLCQTLRGKGDLAFASLSGAAIIGLFFALVLSIAAYSLCYTRCFMQSAEIAVKLPAGRGPRSSLAFGLLDRLFLKTPLQRACYRFALRALFRSEEQAFALGGFLSLGLVNASQIVLLALNKRQSHGFSAIPSAALLSVPLIFGYFLTVGLWSVCAVPALLRANWVFRFNVDPRTRECAPLARKVILTFVVPSLVVLCLPVYSHFWGWRVGVLHTSLVAAWCVLLMEGLLLGFRKIPFACSLPKFRSEGIVTALLFVFGYFAFTSLTAEIESWTLADPFWFFAFVVLVTALWLAFHRWRKVMSSKDSQLIFEEEVTTVETLNLTS